MLDTYPSGRRPRAIRGTLLTYITIEEVFKNDFVVNKDLIMMGL